MGLIENPRNSWNVEEATVTSVVVSISPLLGSNTSPRIVLGLTLQQPPYAFENLGKL